jgi:hypothetical protein
MSDSLRHFMVTLATDVDALAAFIMDPIKAIKAARLTEEDATVLTSGDQTRIYVALSGIKLPIATRPAAEQNAPSRQPASASAIQQPSPAYPVVVDWSGATAQPAGNPSPANVPPAGSPSAYPAPAYPAPPCHTPVYPAPPYSQEPYPLRRAVALSRHGSWIGWRAGGRALVVRLATLHHQRGPPAIPGRDE